MSKIDKLMQFLEEDPNDPFLHFALAKEYEKADDLPRAKVKYSHLVKEHPDYVGTYYHLGKLLVRMEKYDQAIQTYQAGIAIATAQGDGHSRSELEGALLEIAD